MWYDVGTVSVTNGSTTVTGSGTDFISGVQVGEGLYIGGDLYEIGVINSSTQLTLSDAYLGSTATGQAYKIIPTQSLVADLSSGVADLISDFADVRDYAGNGKFNDGTQASPAITFTQDQNNGLYRIGSDNWGMSAGGQLVADVSTNGVGLPDGKKMTFGASDDLQIYHDGSNSYITNSGSGSLIIQDTDGAGDIYLRPKSGQAGIGIYNDNTVEIAHAGSIKLATTSTGVDVTGTVTADGLKIANSTYITQNDGISSNPRILGMNSSGTTYIGPIDSYRGGSIFYGASANVSNQFFYTGGNQTMRLIQGGDVHFYEDTGTTAKMVWDASAESLGIGTANPIGKLHADVSGTTDALVLSRDGGSNGKLEIDFTSAFTNFNSATGGFTFSQNDNERARIDSSGNLLVGRTTSLNNGTISVTGDATQAITAKVTNNGNSVFQGFNSSDLVTFQVSGSGVVSHSGIMYPRSDATVDLGLAANRYKDLYLSGGVYLGGTGAVNKLDDYETGSWTPGLLFDVGGTGVTTTGSGRYTKIGQLVTVQFSMAVTGGTTNDFFARLSGIPFFGTNLSQSVGRVWLQNPIRDTFNLSTEGGTDSLLLYATNGASDFARGDDLAGQTISGSFSYRASA